MADASMRAMISTAWPASVGTISLIGCDGQLSRVSFRPDGKNGRQYQRSEDVCHSHFASAGPFRARGRRGLGDCIDRRFGIYDFAAGILHDRKCREIFDLRIHAVARQNAVEPWSLVERLGVGQRVPLIDASGDAVLGPDELLADETLLAGEARRDLVEVRQAFVSADGRRKFVAQIAVIMVLLLGSRWHARSMPGRLRTRSYKSSTSRSLLQPEQQIIMVLLAACSWSDSTASR